MSRFKDKVASTNPFVIKISLLQESNKHVIFQLTVRLTSGLKMLPSACDLGQHFQDLGHSFSLYGICYIPQITYMVSPNSFLSSKRLKLKLIRVFLAGRIVAMVTCYIKGMTVTCLPMNVFLYDTIIIVVSLVKQWWYSSFKVYIAVREVLKTVASLLNAQFLSLVTVDTSCPQVPFEKVGCFNDFHITSARPLPDYLFNDRDDSIDNYSGRRVDWVNWDVYVPQFACRCAAAAKAKNHTFFGMQFYGK